MSMPYTIQEINEKIPAESLLQAIGFTPKVHTTPNGTRQRIFLFQCKCQNIVELPFCRVINGNTMSCGCMSSEWHSRKYSITIKKLRTCYTDMIRRCYNPNCANYIRYGAKGVTVCQEWRDSYQAFLDWAIENGWKETMHLDKDKKGDGKLYSPETCCWVSFQESQRYKTTTRYYIYNNTKYTVDELSAMCGVNKSTLYTRLKNPKISIDRAMSLQPYKK